MATFVTMKWTREQNRQRNRAEYTSVHVNNINRMLKQTQRSSFRLVCLCDDGAGLDDDIEVVLLPEAVRSMVEIPGQNLGKLYLFSREFRQAIGEDFIFLDLDVIVSGDMSDLFSLPEDLGILAGTALWRGRVIEALERQGLPRKRGIRQIGSLLTRVPPGDVLRFLRRGCGRWSRYNSSLLVIKANIDYRLWEDLPPTERALRMVADQGLIGTDQAWIQVGFKGSVRVFGPEDGMWRHLQLVRHYRRRKWFGERSWAPRGLRLIIFPGLSDQKPWAFSRGRFPWVDSLYHHN